MKTYIKSAVFIGIFSMLFSKATAQDWSINGNQINGGEWFGATNTSTIPLEIQHRANYPINISTINTLRLQFTTGGAFGAGATQGDGLRFFDPSGV